ncbi:Serine/threonine-protein kinase CTR1 [Pelomyxa schiedti]|nr:Serine/threonine-protein kinase CTR1 [Pelomyxa schiedti]
MTRLKDCSMTLKYGTPGQYELIHAPFLVNFVLFELGMVMTKSLLSGLRQQHYATYNVPHPGSPSYRAHMRKIAILGVQIVSQWSNYVDSESNVSKRLWLLLMRTGSKRSYDEGDEDYEDQYYDEGDEDYEEPTSTRSLKQGRKGTKSAVEHANAPSTSATKGALCTSTTATTSRRSPLGPRRHHVDDEEAEEAAETVSKGRALGTCSGGASSNNKVTRISETDAIVVHNALHDVVAAPKVAAGGSEDDDDDTDGEEEGPRGSHGEKPGTKRKHKKSHKKCQTLETVYAMGREWPVEWSSANTYRQVVFSDELKLATQNPKKENHWGEMAKKGSKITWIQCPDRWGCVLDGVIFKKCKALIPASNGTEHAPAKEHRSLNTTSSSIGEEVTSECSHGTPVIQPSQKRSRTDQSPTTCRIEPTKILPSPTETHCDTSASASDTRPMCIYGNMCYRKNPEHLQRFQHPKKIEHPSLPTLITDLKPVKDNNSTAQEAEIQPFPDVHIIKPSDIITGEKLGAGSFGEVRKATWNHRDVAIKIMHKQDEKSKAMFLKEAALMCKCKHINIVRCHGVCTEPTLSIVMEYLPQSLIKVVKNLGGRLLGTSEVLFFACGIAQGVEYLHSLHPQIIHRDLKPDNILLDDHNTPKICDFGVSRERAEEDLTMTKIGTPLYCAPEVMTLGKYNEKADVYSFGMLLFFMVTGNHPFASEGVLSGYQIMLKVAVNHQRPEIPTTCEQFLASLIHKCWDKDPNTRPTMAQVKQQLEEFSVPFKH